MKEAGEPHLRNHVHLLCVALHPAAEHDIDNGVLVLIEWSVAPLAIVLAGVTRRQIVHLLPLGPARAAEDAQGGISGERRCGWRTEEGSGGSGRFSAHKE